MKEIIICANDNCENPVGQGRSDKKFCSNECRSEQNNIDKKKKKIAAAADPRVAPYIEAVQHELLKNRQILATCCPGRDTSKIIKLQNLKDMNFNLKYFTCEMEPTNDGHIYRFCFEYGYWIMNEKKVCIVHRPELLNYPPLNGVN